MIRSSIIRRVLVALLALSGALSAALAGALACNAAPARAAGYVPGEVIVGYAAPPSASMAADVASAAGAPRAHGVAASDSPTEQVLRLAPGVSVWNAIARLRHRRGVVYAVPDYIAHAAGRWIPDDPGRARTRAGWELLQWNFLAGEGVDAPAAWANLIADHRPGGRGVVVAVLDTGVAYRDWRQFRRSPDFAGTRFVAPYDFVAHNAYPLDRDGHGTFVAGTIAEATNNGIGLTGLAYGASLMPVRVLDAAGNGDSATIARGIRYAVSHGAQVINLSLEFDLNVNASWIPDIIDAIGYAHRHGVVVVAAAGNDSSDQIAYPARARLAISVGATTRDRCLAEYSNAGPDLDLVAPGGGDDSALAGDPNCNPDRNLPDVFQMTFFNPWNPRHFGLPGGWYGTSMAAPEVAATAALVIASGVIGRHPTPEQILARLEQTAQPLGGAVPNAAYGYGLIDAGAATARTAAATRR